MKIVVIFIVQILSILVMIITDKKPFYDENLKKIRTKGYLLIFILIVPAFISTWQVLEADKEKEESDSKIESLVNPIAPMDIVIEYKLKVANEDLKKYFPYIETPTPEKKTSFNTISVDRLSELEKEYVVFFTSITFSKYSAEKNTKIGVSKKWEKGFLIIEQQDNTKILISGTAESVKDSVIISIWKTMENVFLRNKDYAGIQTSNSLLGWYISAHPGRLPANIKLINISLIKVMTGNANDKVKSQKLLINSIPFVELTKEFGLFEKKISAEDFRPEYQGP